MSNEATQMSYETSLAKRRRFSCSNLLECTVSTSHMFLIDMNRNREWKSRDLLVIAVEECEI